MNGDSAGQHQKRGSFMPCLTQPPVFLPLVKKLVCGGLGISKVYYPQPPISQHPQVPTCTSQSLKFPGVSPDSLAWLHGHGFYSITWQTFTVDTPSPLFIQNPPL